MQSTSPVARDLKQEVYCAVYQSCSKGFKAGGIVQSTSPVARDLNQEVLGSLPVL